jgi:hypothetical protein
MNSTSSATPATKFFPDLCALTDWSAVHLSLCNQLVAKGVPIPSFLKKDFFFVLTAVQMRTNQEKLR